ncbi:hypothetical protein QOZ80_5BG0440550 [Eleusine coracana subsp. coracana]|nr:hypothetical protein QOZ80_5BG0440550 [Eleusine coracana subsp. coracana]
MATLQLMTGMQVTSAGEKVKVTAIPILQQIKAGQECSDFELLVRVEAPPVVKRRLPIDLVAVLDVSGSMGLAAAPLAKKPSRLDLVKKAMKTIIMHLHDDDRLAIVAFNDKVVTEYTTNLFDIAGGRVSAKRRVDELVAKGDTAFKPGLTRAVEILDGRADKNRLGFVVLLSDGLDNSGIKWNDATMVVKYPVHTFGFSTGHDPKALLAIAQLSHGGTYSFIDGNLSKITHAFAMCLGGLKSVVAVDVEVKISLHSTFAVTIKKIESGGYKSSIESNVGVIVIDLLYAGEVKNFIIHLHVPARPADHEAWCVTGKYRDALGAQLVDADHVNQWIKIQRPAAVDAAPSLIVQDQIARFKVLDILVKLHDEFNELKNVALIKKGDDEIHIAKEAQRRVGNVLQSKLDELKKSDKYWKDGHKSDVDLGGLEKDGDAMVSSLRRGQGVAYIYSWISSHQMQRATTMGSPDKVAVAFLTPRMRAMLYEAQKQQVKDEDGPHQMDQGTGHDGCRCVAAEDSNRRIDQRLEMWCKLKREAAGLFEQPSSAAEDLTAVFRDASLETINRAMHHDIYLAVVHASNLRRCSEAMLENNLTNLPHGDGEVHHDPEATPPMHDNEGTSGDKAP